MRSICVFITKVRIVRDIEAKFLPLDTKDLEQIVKNICKVGVRTVLPCSRESWQGSLHNSQAPCSQYIQVFSLKSELLFLVLVLFVHFT